MLRRVISVDIERAPADAPFMEENAEVEFNVMNGFKKAGTVIGHVRNLIDKAKAKGREAIQNMKDGAREVTQKEHTRVQSEIVSCLDEAEKHLGELERGMSHMQWMGSQNQQQLQQQVHYMPLHAAGGPQYYRM